MKRLLPFLLLLGMSAFGQAPTRIVNSLTQLDAWYPSYGQPAVSVLGHTVPGDWGPAKLFRYDRTNALATNAVRRATIIGTGRWVHDWDGDVRAFGALGDGVTLCNNALSNAWAVSRRLYFPKGRYLIDNSATVDHNGNPCGIFMNPATDLASRLDGPTLIGDGYGKSVIQMTKHLLRVIGGIR